MDENKKVLPVNQGRLVCEQARATVKSLLDAIVELVTNSDDSFHILEQERNKLEDALIEIRISRALGGGCKELMISDSASGMSREELLNEAIKFGGETGGRQKGRKVRGFFGRGLKESIIALGEGTILTKKNNSTSAVKIWVEGQGRNAMPYYSEITGNSLKDLTSSYLHYPHGTVIIINNINSQFKLADYSTFKQQITNHYALRDINSNPAREIKLNFIKEVRGNQGDLEIKERIQFVEANNKLVLDKKIELSAGQQIRITIKEAEHPLESPTSNPFALAGLLIKSGGAILENTLFKYNNEPAALYFFGVVDVPEIAERLNQDEMLVSPNRIGLDWRHDFLSKLKEILEDELSVIVNNKKKELEQNNQSHVSDANKELINKIRDLLNTFAKQEMLELEQLIEPEELDTIIIKPEITHLEVQKPKTLSIYVPAEIAQVYPLDGLELSVDNQTIILNKKNLSFKQHKNHKNLLVGHFTAVGSKLDEEGIILCSLGSYEAIAEVIVTTKEEGKKRKKLTPKSGGFIKNISPDHSEDPIQRVYFDRDLGEIMIYVNFPGVKNYIKPGLEGIDKPEGSILLAELVAEAFCRAVAIDGIDKGKYMVLGDPIDSYNRIISDIQKKYLDRFHKVVIEWSRKRATQ